MRRAVCVVVLAARAGEAAGERLPPSAPRRLSLLMVSRGRNTSSFGLPGGKVEARDASVKEAAARELQEETGLAVRPDELQQVFERTCKGHLSTCFMVRMRRVVTINTTVVVILESACTGHAVCTLLVCARASQMCSLASVVASL